MKLWTLTTADPDNNLGSTIHVTQQDALDTLRLNFADGVSVEDISDDDLIDHVASSGAMVDISSDDVPVELLVIRDPDGGTDLTLFVDGQHTSDWSSVTVDPGYGHERADWIEARNNVTGTPAFVEAAQAAYDDNGDSEYVTGDLSWTFVGHWENGRIVVEDVYEGEEEDDREDTGQWDEGLFAASGSGATMEEAEAAVRAEYETTDDTTTNPDEIDDTEESDS